MAGNKLTGMAREVAEKYRETLVTLTFNDKIRINTLTEIAKEDQKYANVIVDCIEARLRKVSKALKFFKIMQYHFPYVSSFCRSLLFNCMSGMFFVPFLCPCLWWFE